jgi:iron complex outermembrane receptor protein
MFAAKASTRSEGRRVERPLGPAGAAVALLLAVCPAMAQQPDTARADSVPVYKLEGITVTVSRSKQEVQKLPYAIGVLGASEIQGLQTTISLDEALPGIPGVFVSNRYNFALGDRISIRGFGARSQFGVRGIRVIQDGIPLTLPDGQSQLNNLDLSAAGRIEVIRGPASALYGNASGGVVSVQTESPPPRPLAADARALGGSFGESRLYQKYDVKAAGQQGRFDYFGHVGYFRTDGYRLHSAARYTLVNGRLRYRPDADSEITVVVNFADTPQAESPSTLTDSLARVKPDTARDLALSPEQCPPEPGFGGCQDLGDESKQGQAGISYRRQLSAEHQLSLMAYGLVRELENRIPFTLIQLDRAAAGARAEYRYAPLAGRVTAVTAGVDLDHQGDDRLENARDADQLGPVNLDQDERVTSLGLFAQGGLAPVADVELTLSLRYDRVTFEVDDRLVTAADPDDSGSRKMDQLSPMAGLRYTHARWLNVYGNVGRSFQTPTTTELTDSLGGFNETLQPERAINYEFGLKGTAADHVTYSLALFHADIDDLIVGSAVPGIERVFFDNAGSGVHKGVEAGLSALLAEGLVFTTSYTYSDFRFKEFQTEEDDYGGNRLPGVPPNRFYGRLTYSHRSRATGSMEVRAADSYFVDNANENRNDGYAVVDLRFGYSLLTPKLEIRPVLGLNNLFDQRYNSSVVVNTVGGRYYEPAPGRNVYLGLRVKTR